MDELTLSVIKGFGCFHSHAVPLLKHTAAMMRMNPNNINHQYQ